MAFKIDYIQRASNVLGISTDEVREWAYRTEQHLVKHGCSKNEIIRSIFVLQAILVRKENTRKKAIPDFGMKNKTLLAFKVAIANLIDKGYSANRLYDKLNSYRF